ncbi:hypothetical protein [Methylobacterium sp. Gmos1]
MIPRTAAEAADLRRCRERQAVVARQQVEHHVAMQRIWFERAAAFEAEALAAPCDEPAKREDAIAAEGRSPAGAVGEAEAHDLKALQAENERLKANLRDAIAAQLQASENAADREAHIEELTTALAESERKRGEAIEALKPFADFAQDLTDTHPGWDHDAFPLFVAEDVELTLAPFRAAHLFLSALIAREEAEHGR